MAPEGQRHGPVGTDVNIENAWKYGATGGVRGSGIRIGIVDDGVQTSHPDFISNIDTTNDYDWNGKDNDPSPGSGDDHGTACAGNAAARGNNNLGVAGTAPEAMIVGMRLISGEVTDLEESQAMAYLPQLIQIKSNSWGPDDTGRGLEAPGPMTQDAFANSAATGRGGKGSIFVWAGGNGGDSTTKDNSNYDGYANSIYTIAVGATDSKGRRAEYAEPGANLVVCAPSSGATDALEITTTDRTSTAGYNNASGTAGNYASDFGGTSSATPTAAGIIALMLQKNPNLGWRDVQEILIRSAKKIAPSDAGWKTNGAGFNFNHEFGAGLIDATAAVNLATGWTNLAAQASIISTQSGLSVNIPNNNSAGVTREFSIPTSNLRVEHATLRLSVSHASRGELEITLTSPSGTESRLAEVRGDRNANYSDWTFSTVRNWGEISSGTWLLKIADRSGTNSSVGKITAAELKVFGTAAPAVNPAPVVRIVSPGADSVSSPNAAVTVAVSALDFDVSGNPSTVSQVELFRNGTLVGTKVTTPYDFTLFPPNGTNVYTAKATDIEGKIGTSAPVTTTVKNQAPVIESIELNFTNQAFADQQLTVSAVPTTDPENDILAFSYQWQASTDGVSFSNQAGLRSAELPVSSSNAGKLWRCEVSVSDGTNSVSEVSQSVNILSRPSPAVVRGSSFNYQSGLVLRTIDMTPERRMIINEFSQGPSGGNSEWIEFLVLKSGSIRYWDFQDASGNLVVFNDTSIWEGIPAGSLIVVYNGEAAKDPILPSDVFDKTNGRFVISSKNSTYFDQAISTWPPLGNAGGSIFLSDENSNTVHQIAYGNSSFASPNIGSVGSASAAYYAGDTDLGADDGSEWRTTQSNIARSRGTRSTNPPAAFSGGSYIQDFNTTPGSSGTGYPTGWTSYSNLLNDDEMGDGTTLPSSGGNYNYNSKIGLLGSGSAFDPGSLVLALGNTSGLSNLRISYTVEKMAEQTRNMSLSLQYATSDPASSATVWTGINGAGYLSGDSPAGTITNFQSISLPAEFDNRSTTIYLRWLYITETGSGARDALAIDNVSIFQAGNAPSTMSLALNPSTVSENDGSAASTATLTFSATATTTFTVNLSSSNPTAATVPATVTVLAGTSSVSFPVSAIDNNTGDGTRSATITANAAGFAPASDTLSILDDEAPLIGVTPVKGNTPRNVSFVAALKSNMLNTAPAFQLGQGVSLPPGLVLNTATGIISGTVAANAPLGVVPILIERVNSAGETVFQSFDLVVRSSAATFSSWANGFPLSDRTPGGDPDLDGLPNLVEYALGLRPDLRDSAAVVFGKEPGVVTLTYTRDRTVTDVTLFTEWSSTLLSGSWQSDGLMSVTMFENPQIQTVKVSLAIDPSVSETVS